MGWSGPKITPAYDFLNSSIVLKGDIEEIAFSIKGGKSNLTRKIIVDYFGKERCGLADKVIEKIMVSINTALSSWFELIGMSFLSNVLQEKYIGLLQKRIKVLGLDK
jgi:serine/threonine-protein kinase HipA